MMNVCPATPTTMFKLTLAMRLLGYHDYGASQTQMRSAAGSRTSKHSSKGSESSRVSTEQWW